MKKFLTIIVCYLLTVNGLCAQYDLYKLPYPVNTDVYDEICPVLSYEEDELFFTRSGYIDFTRKLIENGQDISLTLSEAQYNQRLKQIYQEIAGTRIENPISSSFNQEVFFSKYADGEVYNTFHPGYPINNALPNSICAQYGPEGSYVVVNEFYKEGGMNTGFSYVNREGKIDFTYPIPIIITNFRMEGSDINLAINRDKSYIIISMEDDGSRMGKELYFSSLVRDGVYSQPRKIKGINTKYDESTPFFTPDGKSFYFTSNRPGGEGGMDIYKTHRIGYSIDNWATPENLGPSINSTYNESYPYVSRDETSILFTTDRDGTSDIYFAKLQNIEELDYKVRVHVFLVDGDDRKKAPAELNWGMKRDEKYTEFFRTSSGAMDLTFKTTEKMKMMANIRLQKSDEIILDPALLRADGVRDIEIDIYKKAIKPHIEGGKERRSEVRVKMKPKKLKKGIIPLEKNSTVVLKNIYFAKAKPDVLKASLPSINNLAEALKNNPQAIVRIEGHTDNVGDKEALLELSQKRAEAIARILIDSGVSEKQLQTKGYGDTRPITQNRSEKERSQNRRVEIRVLEQ